MGLDPEVIKCQNKETYDDCTTRQFLEHIRNVCGCLPLALRLSDEVEAIKFRLNLLDGIASLLLARFVRLQVSICYHQFQY